jgi:transcriptional regulator with XRE-family HTH domain
LGKRKLIRKARDGIAGLPTAIDQEGPAASGIAIRIKARRRSLGLTQDELAQRIGVSRSAIAQWETDRTGQVRANLARMAAVLGVSVGYLLTGQQEGASLAAESADERALINLYRELQDSGRAELLRIARRLVDTSRAS